MQPLKIALLAVAMAVSAHAQTLPPQDARIVPDARRPSRDLQPAPAPVKPVPPPPPVPGKAEVLAGETAFSPSTKFTVEIQPANHPRLPCEEDLLDTPVALYHHGNTFSGSPSSGGVAITVTPAEMAVIGGELTDSARAAIQNAIVARINREGVGGIACLMDPAASPEGANVIKVVAVQVARVRTVGTGVRAGESGQDVDHPRHSTIKELSPIDPGDVLEREVLEDYLYSLSRFPGRTVSAVVTSEPSSAQVVLDFLVQEKNVFDVYVAVSNTGTKETNYWQERVGIFATQLTNNDDILSLEYTTTSFSGYDSFNGYYDARVGTMQDLRWRVTGQWGQYNSSQIGLASEEFNGSFWGAQGDLIWNLHQRGNLFLDLDGSIRGWNSQTSNTLFLSEGDATFITLDLTLDALALGETWAAQGSFGGSWSTTGADQEALDDLGRADTSPTWATINGSVYGSVYLDPWFDSGWGKRNELYKPLVHEIFGSIRGQYAFDYRLTPMAQYVMGGLYTVRGFPQSANAGDSAIVGTIEYRLHLPRSFSAAAPSTFPWIDKPFRWMPDATTGAGPDWDFIVSGFFDGGSIGNSDDFAFEVDTGMLSAGVGLDLTVGTAFSIGVDWGWALNAVPQLDVDAGNMQFWLSASFVY